MRSICLGRDADPKEEVHMKNCIDCDRAYSQNEAASEIGLRVTSSVIRLPSNPISDGKGKEKAFSWTKGDNIAGCQLH